MPSGPEWAGSSRAVAKDVGKTPHNVWTLQGGLERSAQFFCLCEWEPIETNYVGECAIFVVRGERLGSRGFHTCAGMTWP